VKKLLQVLSIFLILVGLFVPQAGTTDIEWTIRKELDLKAPTLDISQSPDGRWLFILTPGEILVYSTQEDKVINRIPVDKAFDRMVYSPLQNTFILSSRSGNIVKIFQLEAVHKFDLSGLPFKGPELAPITLVVFGDYQ